MKKCQDWHNILPLEKYIWSRNGKNSDTGTIILALLKTMILMHIGLREIRNSVAKYTDAYWRHETGTIIPP